MPVGGQQAGHAPRIAVGYLQEGTRDMDAMAPCTGRHTQSTVCGINWLLPGSKLPAFKFKIQHEASQEAEYCAEYSFLYLQLPVMSLLSKRDCVAGHISSTSPASYFSHMFQLHSTALLLHCSTAPLFYFVHWQKHISTWPSKLSLVSLVWLECTLSFILKRISSWNLLRFSSSAFRQYSLWLFYL